MTRTRRGTSVPARSVIDYQERLDRGVKAQPAQIGPYGPTLGEGSKTETRDPRVQRSCSAECSCRNVCLARLWNSTVRALEIHIVIGGSKGERALGDRPQEVGSQRRFLSAEA